MSRSRSAITYVWADQRAGLCSSCTQTAQGNRNEFPVKAALVASRRVHSPRKPNCSIHTVRRAVNSHGRTREQSCGRGWHRYRRQSQAIEEAPAMDSTISRTKRQLLKWPSLARWQHEKPLIDVASWLEQLQWKALLEPLL